MTGLSALPSRLNNLKKLEEPQKYQIRRESMQSLDCVGKYDRAPGFVSSRNKGALSRQSHKGEDLKTTALCLQASSF
jgi:hypothetical protein